MHEVIAPDVIFVGRSQPDAGAVIELSKPSTNPSKLTQKLTQWKIKRVGGNDKVKVTRHDHAKVTHPG